jgi:hypothetical protein
VKEWLRDNIQSWLIEEFMKQSRMPKLVSYMMRTVMSIDAMFVIRAILTKYGVAYLMSYVFWLSML